MAAEKKAIFPEPFEAINLWLPVFFGGLALFEIIFWGRLADPLVRIGRMIGAIVFLNTIHVMFTYVFIGFFPEARAFFRDRAAARKPAGIPNLDVYVVGILICTGFYILNFAQNQVANWVLFPLQVVAMFWPIQHTVAQINGISMCYSRGQEAIGPDSALSQMSGQGWRKIEYRFHLLILLFMTALATSGRFLKSTFRLSEEVMQIYAWTNIALMYLTIAAFLFYAHRHYSFRSSNKVLFLSRYLLFPVVGISGFAQIGKIACHGVEYGGVYATMIKNSRPNRLRLNVIFFATVLVSVFMGVVTLFRADALPFFFNLTEGTSPTWMFVCSFLVSALSFFHYYLDHILFRFRNDESRINVAPLLLGKKSA